MAQRRRLAVEALEDRRMLATFTVTNLLDGAVTAAGQIPGSLRQAIFDANNTAGADDIVFSGTVGTIALSAGELAITEALTIDASGLAANMTINAQQLSRVLNFTAATGDLTLKSLTLQNGRTTIGGSNGSGGGIRFASSGTLTLESSAISGNSTTEISAHGGGIFADSGSVMLLGSVVSENDTYEYGASGAGISTNSGNVTLVNSTISGNQIHEDGGAGGGIRTTSGNVTLISSTVSENRTGGGYSRGGGIATGSGDVTLTNSTVSGNHGGYRFSYGGGISTGSGGDVTLTNSTLSENGVGGNYYAAQYSAGGGIRAGGTVTITSSTVVGNYALGIGKHPVGNASFGGINSSSHITVTNSIVWGNYTSTSAQSNLSTSASGTISGDYNLLGSGSTIGGTHNIIGSNPLLGPLADNGGPTKTHALLEGSPAINAGDPSIASPPDFDQRGEGYDRIFDGRIDMGAYEVQPSTEEPSLVVTTELDVVDEFDELTSLREAILYANSLAGADTITFSALFNTAQTIYTGSQLPTITDDLTITGAGQSLLTIDAGNGLNEEFGDGDGWRIFNIDDGNISTAIDVTISGLRLTGGDVLGGNTPSAYEIGGGAILNRENLSVVDSTIRRNFVVGGFFASGGGIANVGGTLVLTGCTISNNSSVYEGGGISNNQGTVSISQSTISGNGVYGVGQGYQGGQPYDYSFGEGGGVSSTGGSLTIANSVIHDNEAGGEGGGIFSNGTLTVTGSSISQNTAADGGGGILCRGTTMEDSVISGSLITGNSATFNYLGTSAGGGISGRGVIVDCTVSSNTALNVGGGIAGQFRVTRTTVSNNSAIRGGGGISAGDGSEIIDSTVDGNFSTGNNAYGGGIYARSSLTISGSAISNNYATGLNIHGGGIYSASVRTSGVTILTVINSTISGNSTANGFGGGMYIGLHDSIHSTVINNTTITDNTAPVGSGSGVAHRGSEPVTFGNSIVAGNTNEDLAIVSGTINSFASAGYNLIGTGNVYSGANNSIDVFNQPGDTTGVANPLLGALADNGGPTKTHALLEGSLAINAGDPSAVAGVGGIPLYDQRGVGFSRVVNGRIDIGAFEVQAGAPSYADFDGDGDVDGRDFLMWQRGYGITAPNAVKSDGDADNDTDVDGEDLVVWQDQYGENEELSAVSSSDPGDATPGLEDEVAFFIAAQVNQSVDAGTESDAETLYAEEVDLAFEELAATPTSVRSFGEMVARRGVAKRVVLGLVGSAFE